MKKVAVILSAYNGAEFIKEQLNSILNQLALNDYIFDVYCRDDGSQDKTVDILLEYQNKNSNIHVMDIEEKNVGVQNSFLLLLRRVEADFYFFCDQDDIWQVNKLERFMQSFKTMNNKIPGGVYSDLKLVDKADKDLGTSMMRVHGWDYNEDRSLPLLLFQTRVTGAAFAINREARNRLVLINDYEFSKVLMHDSITATLVRAYDNLHFIPECLVNYRQHENNVLGAKPENPRQFDIRFKVKHYRKLFHDINIIWKIVGDNLPEKNRRQLDAAIELASQRKFISKLKSIIKNYKILWRHYRLRHLVLLLFFYKSE